MNSRALLSRAVAGFCPGGGCSPFRIAGSGALISSTSGEGTPFFLTARHHFLFGGNTVRLGSYPGFEAVWDYTEKASFASSRGAILLASDAATDSALLLLNEIPPNRTFLGWRASAVELGELHRLSHPYGYPQAYTYHSGAGSAAPLFYQTRFQGILGPGSSGAPLVTADLYVVGQLWGVSERDGVAYAVDGAFAHAYEKMRPWLDPLGMGEASPNRNDQISCSPPG